MFLFVMWACTLKDPLIEYVFTVGTLLNKIWFNPIKPRWGIWRGTIMLHMGLPFKESGYIGVNWSDLLERILIMKTKYDSVYIYFKQSKMIWQWYDNYSNVVVDVCGVNKLPIAINVMWDART